MAEGGGGESGGGDAPASFRLDLRWWRDWLLLLLLLFPLLLPLLSSSMALVQLAVAVEEWVSKRRGRAFCSPLAQNVIVLFCVWEMLLLKRWWWRLACLPVRGKRVRLVERWGQTCLRRDGCALGHF